MKLVKLTTPDNQPVWIAPSWVIRIMRATPRGLNHPEAHSVIYVSGGEQQVREHLDDVVRMIEDAQ